MKFGKQIGLVGFFMLVSVSLFKAAAQQGDYYTGEVGIGLGAAHYFGDLNSTTNSIVQSQLQLCFTEKIGDNISPPVWESVLRKSGMRIAIIPTMKYS